MPKIIGQNPGDQIHLSDDWALWIKTFRFFDEYPIKMKLMEIFPHLADFNYTIDYERGIITIGERKPDASTKG